MVPGRGCPAVLSGRTWFSRWGIYGRTARKVATPSAQLFLARNVLFPVSPDGYFPSTPQGGLRGFKQEAEGQGGLADDSGYGRSRAGHRVQRADRDHFRVSPAVTRGQHSDGGTGGQPERHADGHSDAARDRRRGTDRFRQPGASADRLPDRGPRCLRDTDAQGDGHRLADTGPHRVPDTGTVTDPEGIQLTARRSGYRAGPL